MENLNSMELMIENQHAHKIEDVEKGKVTIIRIGKYILEYPQNHCKKKPIHKEVMKEMKDQEKDIMDLSWGKYKRYKWDKVFRYIKETSIQKVSAYGNTDKKMLIDLSRVWFHNLTYLDLRDCQLENIQALPSGPNLNYLSLANNNIYTVSSLNKCQLSGLKTLLLNDNPISILGLERCNFELETFWLQRQFAYKLNKEVQYKDDKGINLSNIFNEAKITTNEGCKYFTQIKISIESKKRIYQQGPMKRIHEKYLHLERLLYIDPDFVDQDQIQYINYLSDSEEEEMIPLEQDNEMDEVEPPALHNVQGENEEEWVQELESSDCQDSWSSSCQFQQTKSMSDDQWGTQ